MESNLIHEEQEKKVVKDLHNSIIQKEALIPTSISQTTQLARSGKKKYPFRLFNKYTAD